MNTWIALWAVTPDGLMAVGCYHSLSQFFEARNKIVSDGLGYVQKFVKIEPPPTDKMFPPTTSPR